MLLIEAHKGDIIRITKNRRPDRHSGEKRLNNGALLTLTGFSKAGDLKLSNGQSVPADWGHIDHGVAVTSYGSQGKTYDRVLVAQSNVSFPASDPAQLYVSASRAREQMMVYTDGKDELFAAVSKSRLALNASDLVTDRKQQIAPSNAGRLRQQVDRLRLSAARFAATQWQRLQDHFRQHQREPGMAK